MSNFKQISNANQNAHFSRALFSEVEKSRMTVDPIVITDFNAGDIVPIKCIEILPETDRSIDLDFTIRQTTLKTPTMGQMYADIFAFWVPNRIVNQSWKAVYGENYSGSWTAPEVTLAPLKVSTTGTTQIPVHSVADYYGLPTQQPIPDSVLALCNDLKFRGYVMIYNEHFRDQNYQPPIPMSTLNVYQGFLDRDGLSIPLDGTNDPLEFDNSQAPDGSFGAGSVANSLYGSGLPNGTNDIYGASAVGRFRALHKPFKANKYHDYFTSVLPSPQKSNSTVLVPVSGSLRGVPVVTSTSTTVDLSKAPFVPIRYLMNKGEVLLGTHDSVYTSATTAGGDASRGGVVTIGSQVPVAGTEMLYPANLITSDIVSKGLSIDVSDIRMASAIQQVYEVLARGGSRYRSILSSFFGAEYDEAFCDVPVCLGKISRPLDLFQSAQTSPSESGSTPQGNLAAFGYTSVTNRHFYSHHFVEHGYVHIFAVVRHRNIYSSFMSRDWFRMSMLDFYLPQLANISEQPVYSREINPFGISSDPNSVFGYQEAWSEYRYEPDIVTGSMRTFNSNSDSLAVWNYADSFEPNLRIATGNWLKSNSEQVLNRTLALDSSQVSQFKAEFRFVVDKTLPMPTYSAPGMDII
ncbi:major capsid protein [Dipodfec virus UOA04_Rod_757]|nr:major capsid protein [Dipodfec virus UOA04_Rod_757]